MADSRARYALITPVHNESENLLRLAGCIEQQTIQPTAWIIVDTGSTDGTVVLIRKLQGRLPFIRSLAIDGPSVPRRGGPIVRAFTTGIEELERMQVGSRPEVVIKMDADLSFERDYCERILGAFEADPGLGLTSGICTELQEGVWRPLFGTRSHVWGASRAYRWSCLAQVLPLEKRRGWDEIDSIKAQLRGWRVGTLGDVPFRHHRVEGTRDGSARVRWYRQGGESYFMGYRLSYLVVRAVWRSRSDLGALAMIAGYVAALLRREPRCDPEVIAHLRREQSMRRLPLRLRESLGWIV